MAHDVEGDDLVEYLENRLKKLLGERPDGSRLKTDDYSKLWILPYHTLNTAKYREDGWWSSNAISVSTYRTARELEKMLDRVSEGFSEE